MNFEVIGRIILSSIAMTSTLDYTQSLIEWIFFGVCYLILIIWCFQALRKEEGK